MKLSKARWVRFVHDLPLQGKSAHILNFRARPEQGSNRTERVERSRLCRVVWMFDPAGIGFAPREHRQFPVRPNFSKHRMNEENVMRMPGTLEAQRSRIRDEENFMSGALAGPGLSRSRLHCDCCITVQYRSGPDGFDGAAKINPNA